MHLYVEQSFIVSRSKDKLETVAKEVEEKFDVKTKIVDIDFTTDKNAEGRIEQETADLNVGVLVNNVGVSYQHPEYFLQIGKKQIIQTSFQKVYCRQWSS